MAICYAVFMDGILDNGCSGCAERDRRIAELEKKLAEQNKHLAELQTRLEAVERSSKRQAAPFSQGPPKKDPQKPGRKAGVKHGQHGHRLPPVPEQIDEIHEAPLPKQCDCGGGIHETHVAKTYQSEIPRRVIHRQFNIHCGQCQRCGQRHRGRHPLQTSDATGAAASQLGADVQTAIVYLNKYGGLSYGKIAAVLENFYHLQVTRGACAQVVLRGARRLEPAYEEIRVQLQQAEHITPDETGWRIGGRPVWLHTGVGDNGATLYVIDRQRSADVLQKVIGIAWSGSMTHDGYATYDRFANAVHQQCLDHALRRARLLLDKQGPAAGAFSHQVIDLLGRALDLRDQLEAGVLDSAVGPDAYEDYVGQLLRLTGRHRPNEDNRRFAQHLRRHAAEWFVFLLDASIPATNHRAEQALKTPITTRKVWGGNRAPPGGRAQEVHCSVLQTCKNLAVDVFGFVSQAFRGMTGKLFGSCPPTSIA
jgi:transposase